MEKTNKLKFVLSMLFMAFLCQIPCMNENNIYLPYVPYIFLTIGVWMLGTKRISQQSNFRKKATLSGYIISWCILFFLLIRLEVRFFFANFWVSAPISIFIISKIFNLIERKRETGGNDKYFIILSIIMLIIGGILAYLIYKILFYSIDILFYKEYLEAFVRIFEYNNFYDTII